MFLLDSILPTGFVSFQQLAVLDRAHRGYLGFPLSKKGLGRGKQTFYFNGHAMKRAVLSASSISWRALSKTAKS